LAMNPEGLHTIVRREDISMCGYGPTVSMLTAAKILGASKAELVKYATSGDVSLDFDHVVGYAGIIVALWGRVLGSNSVEPLESAGIQDSSDCSRLAAQ